MKDLMIGLLTEEFAARIKQFMSENQERALQTGKICCLCPTYINCRSSTIKEVYEGICISMDLCRATKFTKFSRCMERTNQ